VKLLDLITIFGNSNEAGMKSLIEKTFDMIEHAYDEEIESFYDSTSTIIDQIFKSLSKSLDSIFDVKSRDKFLYDERIESAERKYNALIPLYGSLRVINNIFTFFEWNCQEMLVMKEGLFSLVESIYYELEGIPYFWKMGQHDGQLKFLANLSLLEIRDIYVQFFKFFESSLVKKKITSQNCSTFIALFNKTIESFGLLRKSSKEKKKKETLSLLVQINSEYNLGRFLTNLPSFFKLDEENFSLFKAKVLSLSELGQASNSKIILKILLIQKYRKRRK